MGCFDSQDGEEVVIQLSQKERRQFPEDSWLNRIGVHVMRVEDNRVFLLHRNQEIVGRTLYQPVRPTGPALVIDCICACK